MIRPKFEGEIWNKARLGRIERGEQRVTVTELADIIEALGVSSGTFYQDAGVVVIYPQSEGWIQADISLTEKGRERVLDVYRLSRNADV